MTFEIYLTTFLAGMLYVLIPGPATLAALSLSANSGRGACARFLACHMLGDVTWATMAIFAIVGVSHVGPALFDTLGIVCGLYLIFLGINALRYRGSAGEHLIINPWKSGFIFGFTNPKAYPFAIAMFTAVFTRFEGVTVFQNVIPLVLAASTGFAVATCGVVLWTGLPIVRRLFVRYGLWITRATGLIFIAFGTKTIGDATSNFRARMPT